jgi:hypothetical protein
VHDLFVALTSFLELCQRHWQLLNLIKITCFDRDRADLIIPLFTPRKYPWIAVKSRPWVPAPLMADSPLERRLVILGGAVVSACIC